MILLQQYPSNIFDNHWDQDSSEMNCGESAVIGGLVNGAPYDFSECHSTDVITIDSLKVANMAKKSFRWVTLISFIFIFEQISFLVDSDIHLYFLMYIIYE